LKITEEILPNGYTVTVIQSSKSIIEEVWKSDFYHRHFLIEKQMTVLDLGANVGLYSLFAAAKGATIYAFEPEVTNYKLLVENVKKNNLQHKIHTFNYAVAKDKKYMDIYLKDYEEDFASCMVSAYKDLFQDFSDKKYQKQSIPCISLKEILNMAAESEIDLMKVDCEGSELEILQSAPSAYFKRIKNMVMETHNTYPEKELYHMVKDLGFSIRAYEKRSGVFCTGYLFAAREKQRAGNTHTNPVALLHAPLFAANKQKLAFDASGSFSTQHAAGIPEYSWSVDGIPQSNAGARLEKYRFRKTGIHTVEVKISEDGFFDSETKQIFILKNNYFSRKRAPIPTLGGKDHTFRFKGEKNFLIPNSVLPNAWVNYNLVLSVGLVEGAVPWNEKRDYLCFNGDRIPLSGRHKQIRFKGIPYNLSILFSIKQRNLNSIKLVFWGENKTTESSKEQLFMDSRATFFLKRFTKEYVCSVAGKHHINISLDDIPVSWNIESIIVSFSTPDTDKIKKQLDFLLNTGTIQKQIHGYYHEIEWVIKRNQPNITFDIKNGKESVIRINWWPKK